MTAGKETRPTLSDEHIRILSSAGAEYFEELDAFVGLRAKAPLYGLAMLVAVVMVGQAINNALQEVGAEFDTSDLERLTSLVNAELGRRSAAASEGCDA